MNRNETLRRRPQMQRRPQPSRSTIPGWLWGIAIGVIGALVAVGVVMRPTSPAPGPVSQVPIPPDTTAAPVSEPPQPEPPEVTIAPQRQTRDAQPPPSRDEELERLRQQIEELQRRNEPVQREVVEAAPPPVNETTEPPEEQPPPSTRPNALELAAQAEAEWRPVFAEYQKRYSEKKAELDKLIGTFEQLKAQCSYTQMGEPTEAQKRKGVRQEGLPVSLISGIPVGYGASCETVDQDLRKAKQERFDALRQIQNDCYQDATARGVSTAKAKLR